MSSSFIEEEDMCGKWNEKKGTWNLSKNLNAEWEIEEEENLKSSERDEAKGKESSL